MWYGCNQYGDRQFSVSPHFLHLTSSFFHHPSILPQVVTATTVVSTGVAATLVGSTALVR